MKKYIFLLITFSFLQQIIFAQSAEQNLVKKAFTNYKTAILNNNGKKAFYCVDSNTYFYFEKMQAFAKTADSVTIDGLNIIDKIMVLSLRHRVEAKDLLTWNTQQIFEFAVNSGMVGKNSVATFTPSKVTIDKKFAKLELLASGKKNPNIFHLYKQNNAWKLDLTSIMAAGAIAFRQMLIDAGKNENEVIIQLLNALEQKSVSPTIWLPLIK